MESQLDIFLEKKLKKKDEMILSDWDIVGHKNQIKYLKKDIILKKLPHAYLFVGDEKIGKKLTAISFIKTLLCTSSFKYCGSCANCTQIEKRIHPDVAFWEDDESIKIEDIRKLISKINLKPFCSPYKIALIDNAEKLTIEASNSLLKTLEEPQGNAIIILVSKNSSYLLPTIVSRLRVIKFSPVSLEEINSLNTDFPPRQKSLILKYAMGRPGIINDFNLFPDKLNEITDWIKELEKVLMLEKTERLSYSANLVKVFEEDKSKMTEMINFWIFILRDALLAKINSIDFEFSEKVELSIKDLKKALNALNWFVEIIKNNKGVNLKLLSDLLILKLEFKNV